MESILTKEVKEIILKLLKKEEIAILVIEDNRIMQQGLEMSLKDMFPNATVYCFEGFEVDEHSLETLIEKGGYDITITGGSLSMWRPHPLFGKSSAKIVEFIKERKPETFVISTSLQPSTNLSTMKKGADLSVDKSLWVEFSDEVKALR